MHEKVKKICLYELREERRLHWLHVPELEDVVYVSLSLSSSFSPSPPPLFPFFLFLSLFTTNYGKQKEESIDELKLRTDLYCQL